MATATKNAPANGEHRAGDDGGSLIVRPGATIGALAEQQRVQAEIQSRLMVAKSCRRDEVEAIDRIKTSCQRPGLAEKAEYAYSRGGTEITGPTIDLLTVIANCWGNCDYGFRELSNNGKESTVEAFAWDLETNAKRTVTFTVQHKRYTRSATYDLTDPRDVYENLANYAQRRVRACLEAIIPPDVVEDAVNECRGTLKANAQVTPDAIQKLMEAFGKLGVSREQLEKRLGRRLDSMQPAQLIGLRRIYKSISDGMSKPADWFESGEEQKPQTAVESAKEALRKKPSAESEDTHDRPQTSESVDEALLAEARQEFARGDSVDGTAYVCEEFIKLKQPNDATVTAIKAAAEQRKAELSPPPAAGRKQKTLA